MLKYCLHGLILTTLAFPLPSLFAQGLYEKISPACVEILVGGRLDGSGAIVCPSGLVLTACHVIRKQSKSYEALSPELGRKPLSLVATYRGSDLALLKLPQVRNPTPHYPWPVKFPPQENRFSCLAHLFSATTCSCAEPLREGPKPTPGMTAHLPTPSRSAGSEHPDRPAGHG